jgi:hypothetical protein
MGCVRETEITNKKKRLRRKKEKREDIGVSQVEKSRGKKSCVEKIKTKKYKVRSTRAKRREGHPKEINPIGPGFRGASAGAETSHVQEPA